jgi:putative ABC transport system ATP-binding protein
MDRPHRGPAGPARANGAPVTADLRAAAAAPGTATIIEVTAEENVALPLLLSGTRRGPAMTAARRWFGTLGLDGLDHRRSGELSGGQAQRVALARGLVAGPEVLFADEPTGSLDSVSGELVMELLTDAAREHGATVILVTHDVRVAAYADREVIVRDGTVGTLTGTRP